MCAHSLQFGIGHRIWSIGFPKQIKFLVHMKSQLWQPVVISVSSTVLSPPTPPYWSRKILSCQFFVLQLSLKPYSNIMLIIILIKLIVYLKTTTTAGWGSPVQDQKAKQTEYKGKSLKITIFCVCMLIVVKVKRILFQEKLNFLHHFLYPLYKSAKSCSFWIMYSPQFPACSNRLTLSFFMYI